MQSLSACTRVHFTFTYQVSVKGMASRDGLDCPGSNLCLGEICHTRPDRLWGPPSLLYCGYPGLKPPWPVFGHPPTTSVEVKETIELFLYSTIAPSWTVLGNVSAYWHDISYRGQSEQLRFSARPWGSPTLFFEGHRGLSIHLGGKFYHLVLSSAEVRMPVYKPPVPP